MKNIILPLIAIFGLSIATAQCPDPPQADPDQYFCSEDSWQNAGLPEDGDVVADLKVCADDPAWTLDWYEDAALTIPIPNPDTYELEDGETYYVTQTDENNCQSTPLAVTVTDRSCACIKNNPVFHEQIITGTTNSPHKTCAAQIGPTANQIFLGTPDAMTDPAVTTTPGLDPVIQGFGETLDRVNPGACSQQAYRINTNTAGFNSNSRITTMELDFVAGEVFVFDFAMVMQNPAGHTFEQQPFFQINIYDSNDDLAISRCLWADAEDCFYTPANPTSTSPTLFTEWSCLKLSTRELLGQAARVEFHVGDCTLGGHWAYMYIGDIYVGDETPGLCDDSTFGYLVIDSVESGTDGCFVAQVPGEEEECSPLLPSSVPLPVEMCGRYDPPVSTGNPPELEDLDMNILQGGSVVGSVTLDTSELDPTTSGTFCFTVEAQNFNISPPYGNFSFETELSYELDCGVSRTDVLVDVGTITICPTAGCPTTMMFCSTSQTPGIGEFDLSDAYLEILEDWDPSDVTVSYYTSVDDAHEGINDITDPENFENTEPFNQIVYIRLDWDASIAPDCYYLVELELVVNELPELDWPEEVVFCDSDFSYFLIATPDNLSNLTDVSYEWFKDDLPLFHQGSAYTATEPGTYEVVVYEANCTLTKTVEVKVSDYKVDAGDDEVACDKDSHTITAHIQDQGSVPPVDPSEMDYLWSTGETTQSITVTESGDYWVEVSFGDCMETDEVKVTLAQSPEINAGDDIQICFDETEVVLEAAANHPNPEMLEYRWYEGGAEVGQGRTLEINTATLPPTADHDFVYFTVEAYEPGAEFCPGESTVGVKYYDNKNCIIPQGISPTATAGMNDAFDLQWVRDKSDNQAHIKIYNRYGTLVYEEQNYANQWDGHSNDGELLPVGMYFYRLDYPVEGGEVETLTGFVYVNY